MFFKILLRDLKRKKTMNAILLVFMIFIGMLVASSLSILYTVTNALDNYKDEANISDIIAISIDGEEDNQIITDWIDSSGLIESYNVDEAITITDLAIELETGALEDLRAFSFKMMSAVPTTNFLAFNEDDEPLVLNEGEIAISDYEMHSLNVNVGDSIKIILGDYQKTLTIVNASKSIFFGNSNMGFSKYFISEADFQYFYQHDEKEVIRLWALDAVTEDVITVEKSFNRLTLNNYAEEFNSSIIDQLYIFDMLSAGIIILVSLFLMSIAFLILRFTIVFTINEEYREIGIMKAIGVKDKKIGDIYLIKYISLSVIGVIIGFILSFPFANIIISGIKKNMLMTRSNTSLLISILGAILVVLLTYLFCKLVTRKIKKVSIVDSIRKGANGEKMMKTRKLTLNKHKKMSVPLVLALSDIINKWKKYIILAIAFFLGTVITIIPINVINTLTSVEMGTMMGIPKTDFHIELDNDEKYFGGMTIDFDSLQADVDDLENYYNDNQIDVNIGIQSFIPVKVYNSEIDDVMTTYAYRNYGISLEDYNYSAGKSPKLANEIAITEAMAIYYNVSIGDYMSCRVNGETYEYLVTAKYQSMGNGGMGLIFGEDVSFDNTDSISYTVFGDVNSGSNKDVINLMNQLTPEHTTQETVKLIENTIGSIADQIVLLSNIIISVVIGVNLLISILLVKLYISNEIEEITTLKTIGMKNRTIKLWQNLRIFIILFIMVFMGVIFANTVGRAIVLPIFRMMGATDINFVINVFEVYFFYPVIIIVMTMLGVNMSLGLIKKANIWEINNYE